MSLEDIDKVSAGYSNLAVRSQANGWIAIGGENRYGERNISNWPYSTDVLFRQNFSVGVDEEGICYYTGRDTSGYGTLKEKVESWNNLKQGQRINKLFAANTYVVAYKKDGTFDFATRTTLTEIENQLKNTYYKDNTFYTFKVEENTAVVEYYSDEDLEVYFSYFDEAGRPIGFEKQVLEPVPNLTKVEFTNDKAHSFMVSIGEPTADKMKFYMEHETDGSTVKIRHCALDGQRIMLAFYDDDDNMLDIKVRTLEKINAMTETPFTCAGATKYKLFIRDGMLPLYKYEGKLN